jgi:vesicle coat complex subunit
MSGNIVKAKTYQNNWFEITVEMSKTTNTNQIAEDFSSDQYTSRRIKQEFGYSIEEAVAEFNR